LFLNKSVFAVDPFLNWKTIESEYLYVHYDEGNKAFAEHVLVIAEAAYKRLTKELDWTPKEKTHVILSDEADAPNGFATPLSFSRTVIFLAPPSSINTLEDFDDWLSTLIFHEFTHIIHLDKSDGSPEFLRNIFGRFLFLFPNIFQPSWVTEGLATYKETYPERGIGRGQSAMFATMMREEVINGLQPVTHVNLPVSTWPAGTTRYLYGVYFMHFIVERYGEEKLQQWIDEYSDNLFPFFINTNANQVFDKNLTPLWQEYQQWLKQHFEPEIEKIKARGLSETRQVSDVAYRTDSVRAIKTDKGEEVYYVRNSGDKRASLMHINASGDSEELLTINAAADLDLHAQAGVLLTQNERCNNYTIYKDIYLYSPQQKSLKRLTNCGRYLYVSWFPDGKQIAAVQHDYGRIALHLLDAQAQLKEVLWQAEDDEVIGQIDVSPDGQKIVASLWRRGSGWNLELFDIAGKQWTKITTGSNIAAYPQFTVNGDILFSYEDRGQGVSGVYNLYRYNIKTQQLEQLTNLTGGAFQSSQAGVDGSIYYTGYSAAGYAIYKLEKAETIKQADTSRLPGNDSLQLISYKKGEHKERDYSALSNMYPRGWFPVFGFSEQRSEFGLTTIGNDALGIHNYSITATYDNKLKKGAGQLSYTFADRVIFSARRLNEITLDSQRNIARISSRNSASFIFASPVDHLRTQYNFLLGAVYDVSSEVSLANGLIPLDDFEDNLLVAGFLYNSSDLNPLSISNIDGIKLRLVVEDSSTLSSDFSGQVYTIDWRGYLRTGRESVFALRFLQGWGNGVTRTFKLGGEGLNDDAVSIVFGNSGESVFNARNYALRGYAEGEPALVGRRVQILSAEWRFPFQRPEDGVMLPPVGIMQWFGGIFAETGTAYQSSPGTYYSSTGFEISADINIFYLLVLRTRLGYAHGFDKDIGENRVYLKIGSSF